MEDTSVGFALIGIETDQFATFEENHKREAKTELGTGLEFQFDEEDKVITVLFAVSFRQKKKTFLKLQVACYFIISDESFDIFSDDSEITLSKGFLTHITMITVGTVRGVLHAKTESTIFNEYLLPTIDVTKMVTEDINFSLDS